MENVTESLFTLDRDLLHHEYQVLRTKGIRRRNGNYEGFLEPHFTPSGYKASATLDRAILRKLR